MISLTAMCRSLSCAVTWWEVTASWYEGQASVKTTSWRWNISYMVHFILGLHLSVNHPFILQDLQDLLQKLAKLLARRWTCYRLLNKIRKAKISKPLFTSASFIKHFTNTSSFTPVGDEFNLVSLTNEAEYHQHMMSSPIGRMCKENQTGPSTEPWGTQLTSPSEERSSEIMNC